MSLEVRVLDDPATACAEMLHAAATAGASEGNGGTEIVLTGGSTPATAYRHAARLGGDWSAGRAWLSDERCVPVGDERSNARLVRENLLDLLGVRAPRFVPAVGDTLDPVRAADAFEAELRDAGPPRFALALLGLGPDAHIASLFPGQSSLAEQTRLAVGVPLAGHEPYVPRVTLTLPALARAEQVVFLVTGEAKADAVSAAFGHAAAEVETRPDPQVPATLLVAAGVPITLLLDDGAASRL